MARAGGARDLEIVPQFIPPPWKNFRFLIFLGLVESYLAVQLIDFLNLASRVGKAKLCSSSGIDMGTIFPHDKYRIQGLGF